MIIHMVVDRGNLLIQIFQILLETIYFQFTFTTEKLGKWITELSIRAISITKEYIIEFDELQTLRNVTQDYLNALDEVIYAKRVRRL